MMYTRPFLEFTGSAQSNRCLVTWCEPEHWPGGLCFGAPHVMEVTAPPPLMIITGPCVALHPQEALL